MYKPKWVQKTNKYNEDELYEFTLIIDFEDERSIDYKFYYSLIRDILYWAGEEFGFHWQRKIFYISPGIFRIFDKEVATLFALRWL